MIRHTVVFILKDSKGSSEERLFMDAALKQSSIPGVHHFECLRQTSKKNNFTYGLSMEFDTIKEYGEYNKHPDIAGFVQTIWIRYVQDSLEIDYEAFK